ncbi:MAG: PQQ-binding-like beta-propeller repeat protein [Actinomycetota bacterium]
MIRRSITFAVVAALVAPLSAGAASDGCRGAGAAWSAYGSDNRNSRNVSSQISAENAGSLEQTLQIPTQGVVQNTPVIAQGCVYLTTDQGHVTAHTLDGTLQWTYSPTGPFESTGGAIVASPLYHQGRLYVAVNRTSAPALAVLDAMSGFLIRETTLDTWPKNFATAAPVLAGDMIFVGISGSELEEPARGGYVFTNLDGEPYDLRPDDDGTYAAYTITDEEYADGYRGASVWTTGAYDAGEKAIYVGGGNPASKRIEHRYSNAMLKIDADRSSDTFGEIVAAFKGNNDAYYPGIDRQPACEQFGEIAAPFSVTCLQMDLDFGASPNLWVDERGNTVVGNLQKSGIYYALYADNMQMKYSSIVGGPCLACNAVSGATDDEKVYTVGTPGGVIEALYKRNGAHAWAFPVADGIHFQPVSVTNDVVVTLTTHGVVILLDAETGLPLKTFTRQDAFGGGWSSSGPAISEDSIWVPMGSAVLRFQLT